MSFTVYLSGEIHTSWREEIQQGAEELWSNLVYGHQAVFLSDCSITCSPSWNLTLLTTRVSS